MVGKLCLIFFAPALYPPQAGRSFEDSGLFSQCETLVTDSRGSRIDLICKELYLSVLICLRAA